MGVDPEGEIPRGEPHSLSWLIVRSWEVLPVRQSLILNILNVSL